jgi:hypothetical protein
MFSRPRSAAELTVRGEPRVRSAMGNSSFERKVVALARPIVHATPQDEASAPFGGIGQSGLGGRSGGDANLEEFTERRWLTLNPGAVHYPY